ncbi:hypothetical protein [Pulveribacter suum]|uniref:Uncharacterized protein n=1 Tax=Pulveribacter suum TaxID=2116657 RepID=A0A2P1NNB8_9BURK|nr:hypothetical protein [Pulveribacter suum]AVP58545.1 hypothetical protein C7H73_13300 [Pulveribacter suum]
MALQFLDFDYSEAEDGVATWDAIASVPQARLDALAQEAQSILAWACAEFGALHGPHEEGGLWQYDLQCERPGQPLQEIRFDEAREALVPALQAEGDGRVTLTLSVSGLPAFAEAFAARFGL